MEINDSNENNEVAINSIKHPKWLFLMSVIYFAVSMILLFLDVDFVGVMLGLFGVASPYFLIYSGIKLYKATNKKIRIWYLLSFVFFLILFFTVVIIILYNT